ncbi:aminodeoxychorismate synthase component I [Parendozoicomonas sp. Alg238-R29]|uniref:aminodeoxychorismate synthase component I n=1 Tax=Parendozoicomonas sp. Alg238-R29 TaxID=2993446 RepID=UPI00248E5003|nr:aminodeoxychorismate synthase component I [Parendozoicomonas sp. Alg238-R29]
MPHLPYRSTPGDWFEPLRSLGHALLLDSSDTTENQRRTSPTYGSQTSSASRYDIITAAPELVTIVKGEAVVVYDPSDRTSVQSDQSVFDILAEQLNKLESQAHNHLPFTGGLAGFWGYELNHQLEPARVPPRSHGSPDMIVGLYLWAVITDHHKKSSEVFFHPSLAEEKKNLILDHLMEVAEVDEPDQYEDFHLTDGFQPAISRERYNDSFQRIQDWISSGDCYQVNLTQKFSAPYKGDPWQAYKNLRKVSPTPFSAYLDFPELTILSHSPERLLLSENGQIETKPIKGTRPRGETPAQDKAYAAELLSSTKDRAENLMIVDLLRNDLGRNCTHGSIRVPTLFGLESYANVHHMVSTITGELAEGRSNIDLLRDAFPGGSVTGAPKIRSMEIIRELEPDARSVYCGAIGYISCNGRMDTNIPIRTLVADGQDISCWGGGAIVADSECDSEYEESVTKVRNLINGLEGTFLQV